MTVSLGFRAAQQKIPASEEAGYSFAARDSDPGFFCYGSNPNTATLLVVAAKTLPSAIIGVMNLLPAPK